MHPLNLNVGVFTEKVYTHCLCSFVQILGSIVSRIVCLESSHNAFKTRRWQCNQNLKNEERHTCRVNSVPCRLEIIAMNI